MSEKSAFDVMMDSASTEAPASSAPSDQGTGSQPRDEAGRFAAAPATPATPPPDPAPAPQPAPAAAAALAQEPKQEAIPLATALEWRDRMKKAESRLQEVDRQPVQPQQVPSATADPEAYAAYMADLAENTRRNTLFEVSETMAREKHGDDAVQKAMDWALGQAQASPAFAAEYLKQRHPIDWAVKQQKRYSLLDAIGDDPEAYITAEIARRSAAAAPVAQPAMAASPQPAATPAPSAPRSIASAPTAGSHNSIPTGPGQAFDTAFT